MKEFKGTQGPWLVDGQGNGARWNIDDKNGYAVSMSFQRPNDNVYSERDANAKLISAAPELLEALQLLLDDYRGLVESGVVGNFDFEIYPPAKRAKESIAKALGE